MTNWTANECQVNGIRLHYYRTGGARPPLVLAHGFSDDGLCWTRLARDLEADYDIIMPDAHGHGLSERVQPGRPIDLPAELVGLIEALDLHGVILLGHSMGAFTAAAAAASLADQPGRVRGLLLEDPPWRMEVQPLPVRTEYVQWLETVKGQTTAEVAAEGARRNPTWNAGDLEFWAASKQRMDVKIVTERPPYDDWQQYVHKIACPTLLMTGENERGALVTPEVAARVVACNPRVQVVQIAGAGHCLRYEQYPAYLEVVTKFLESLPPVPPNAG